jgi:hypothetical protein
MRTRLLVNPDTPSVWPCRGLVRLEWSTGGRRLLS